MMREYLDPAPFGVDNIRIHGARPELHPRAVIRLAPGQLRGEMIPENCGTGWSEKAQNRCRVGEPYRVSWWMQWDAPFPPATDRNDWGTIVAQLWSTRDRPPVLALICDTAGRLVIARRHLDGDTLVAPHVAVGQWADHIGKPVEFTMVWRLGGADDNAGAALAVNGAQVWQQDGPLGYGVGATLKLGLYRARGTEPVSASYWNVRYWAGL